MTLAQVLQWLPSATLRNANALAASALYVSAVNTDSRSIAAGQLFIALRGERFDGHAYLAQAIQQGAAAAIVADDAPEIKLLTTLPLFVVNDTEQALQQLAKAYRAQFDIPLAVVVGSNGKTTVTQMIASIFRAHCGEGKASAAHATVGNFNNHIGLPLTLLKLNPRHRYSVVELGMNHAGETAQLATIAAPSIAVINNAQREHQEFMHTVEAVAHEHGALITALPDTGVVVLPAQDDYYPLWRQLAGTRAVIDFALFTNADDAQSSPALVCGVVRGLVSSETLNQRLVITTPQGSCEVMLNIAGQHHARNALAATAAALAANIPLPSIEAGLNAFEPGKGRMQQHTVRTALGDATIIDDTYNANPDSVDAGIAVLAHHQNSILILGDMGEVGEQGVAFHQAAGNCAAVAGIAQLYTLGALCRYTHKEFSATGRPCQHFDSHEALANFLRTLTLPNGGMVLIKGSRFMTMEKALAVLLQRHTTHESTY